MIKLPKKVAEELQEFKQKKSDYLNFHIITYIYNSRNISKQSMSPMVKWAIENSALFLQALADGYEVEQTPEDKVKDYFETVSGKLSHLLGCGAIDYAEVERWKGEKDGILNTLLILKIKIPGVSA